MSDYCQKIIVITEDYLGPAAERFVKRQIAFHLEKRPEELTGDDIKKLAAWIKTALSMLTKESEQAQDAYKRIYQLSK
jgi:hypothetical protein